MYQTEETGFEYNAKCVDAVFERKAEFGDNMCLVLELDSDAEKPEKTIILSCGAGWESDDNGKSVTHPSRGMFTKNSSVGIFYDAIKELDGAEEMFGDESPMVASTWTRLEGHFKQTDFNYTDRDTGKEKTGNRMLPTELFTAAVKGARAAAGYEPPASVKSKLDRIAAAVSDHDTFVDQAFTKVLSKDDALAEDKDLNAYINNPENWTFGGE